MNERLIPGVRVYPTRFRPSSSNLANKQLEGVRFVVTDRARFDSTRFGVELAAALQKLYPGKIDFEKCRSLIGSRAIVDGLKEGQDASTLWKQMESDAELFTERRKVYLLY